MRIYVHPQKHICDLFSNLLFFIFFLPDTLDYPMPPLYCQPSMLRKQTRCCRRTAPPLPLPRGLRRGEGAPRPWELYGTKIIPNPPITAIRKSKMKQNKQNRPSMSTFLPTLPSLHQSTQKIALQTKWQLLAFARMLKFVKKRTKTKMSQQTKKQFTRMLL